MLFVPTAQSLSLTSPRWLMPGRAGVRGGRGKEKIQDGILPSDPRLARCVCVFVFHFSVLLTVVVCYYYGVG